MTGKKSLSSILYYTTNAGIALLGLITGYLLIMAFLALIGQLPAHMDASFEVPIHLQKMDVFYPAEDLDSKFYSTHIEVKKAELEVLPHNRTWPQTIGYLHAGLYLSFFLMILFHLSKVLKSFKTGQPFLKSNVRNIRWIGLFTLAIGIYEFFLMTLVAQFFHDKFSVTNALMLQMPSFWDLNLVALFLGLVFLALSEVFKTGAVLQELEEQTV